MQVEVSFGEVAEEVFYVVVVFIEYGEVFGCPQGAALQLQVALGNDLIGREYEGCGYGRLYEEACGGESAAVVAELFDGSATHHEYIGIGADEGVGEVVLFAHELVCYEAQGQQGVAVEHLHEGLAGGGYLPHLAEAQGLDAEAELLEALQSGLVSGQLVLRFYTAHVHVVVVRLVGTGPVAFDVVKVAEVGYKGGLGVQLEVLGIVGFVDNRVEDHIIGYEEVVFVLLAEVAFEALRHIALEVVGGVVNGDHIGPGAIVKGYEVVDVAEPVFIDLL